jgi:hypothetical protein
MMKPPWGRITAIDLNEREIVWQVAHGETPDFVRNHPPCAASTSRAPAAPGAPAADTVARLRSLALILPHQEPPGRPR